MSFTGKFTSLGLNVYGELQKNRVFFVSDIARSFQGTWSSNNYTQGTITASTVLNKLTQSIPNFYNLAKNNIISVELYRNILKIGRPINRANDNRINCPALGNSRPDTFKTSYAGYGTWNYQTVDEFGNTSVSAPTPAPPAPTPAPSAPTPAPPAPSAPTPAPPAPSAPTPAPTPAPPAPTPAPTPAPPAPTPAPPAPTPAPPAPTPAPPAPTPAPPAPTPAPPAPTPAPPAPTPAPPAPTPAPPAPTPAPPAPTPAPGADLSCALSSYISVSATNFDDVNSLTSSNLASDGLAWSGSTIQVNVTSYGAFGNDSVDDTAAIVNAIADCPSGGTVYFHPGVYIVSSTIYIPSNIRLLGDYLGTSIIRLASGAPAATRVLQNQTFNGVAGTYTNQNIRLENMVIDGNSNAGRTEYLAAFMQVQNLQIIKCGFINNTFMGVALAGCATINIWGTKFANCGKSLPNTESTPALFVGGTTNFAGPNTNISVNKCVFRNNKWSGIYFFPTSGSVRNSLFVNNGESSIFGNNTLANATFENNYFYGATRANISASGLELGGTNLTIRNNFFRNSGSDGLSLTNVKTALVEYNTSYDNGQENTYPSFNYAGGYAVATINDLFYQGSTDYAENITFQYNRAFNSGGNTQLYGLVFYKNQTNRTENSTFNDNNFYNNDVQSIINLNDGYNPATVTFSNNISDTNNATAGASVVATIDLFVCSALNPPQRPAPGTGPAPGTDPDPESTPLLTSRTFNIATTLELYSSTTPELYSSTTPELYSSTTPELAIINEIYPPKDYPKSGAYSYVYNTWGSTTSGPYSYEHQWNHPYGWVIGWPSRNKFENNVYLSDTYEFAYFPRPDLRERDKNLIEYDEYFKHGFIATVARQAYYELWSDHLTRRKNQYTEIIKSFEHCHNWKQSKNLEIASFVNSKTFLKGNFSNMNDLTTSDIAGVSLAFKLFGNDMIKLGKSLNMSNIDKFGLPSKFLLNLQAHGALTDALKLALLYNDLTTIELSKIFESFYIPSVAQEKQIYAALDLIRGQDLENIKLILNCTTENLVSLVDLLNPQKMFPNSYRTLTIPKYSINNPATSKVYDFIYTETGVNNRIENWGEYLSGILSDELTIAAGAFMMTMSQIKNIRLMNTEKLAQTVANIEVTDKALPLINSADSSAVNLTTVNDMLSLIALGSGNGGTYRQCDFFGAASGYPYRDYYQQFIETISRVPDTTLKIVYDKLYQKSLNNNWALISRGKGYQDTIVNPAPSWEAKYAYTLFCTQETALASTTTIVVQHNLTAILTSGKIISFNSTGANSYTVLSSSFNGTNTVVTVTQPLTSRVDAYTAIYIYETEYENSIQDLIDAANLEILKLTTTDPQLYEKLNYYWDKIGQQLYIEQRAIPLAITTNEEIYGFINGTEFQSFVRSVENYALKTEYGQEAPVLEAISDNTLLGGQSLIAMMRESRNAQRIINVGGELDNDVPDTVITNQATAEVFELTNNGGIASIGILSEGNGYSNQNPPSVRIGPCGGVFGGSGSGAVAQAVVENGSISKIVVVNSGSGYNLGNACLSVQIDPPPTPVRLGNTTVPGSFAGSPYTGTDPVPDNLVTTDDASYSTTDAIDTVTICNCDCWTN